MWYHSEMVQRHYRYYGLISWAAWILITLWALPWPQGWSLQLFYFMLSISYPAIYLLPAWLVSTPLNRASIRRPESFKRRFSAFLANWIPYSAIMTLVSASWLLSAQTSSSSAQQLSRWLISTSQQLNFIEALVPQQWLSNALLPACMLILAPAIFLLQWSLFRIAHLIAKNTRQVPKLARWAVLLLAITVSERVFYGFGDFYQIPAVNQLAMQLPGYQPMTMQGFLTNLRFRQPANSPPATPVGEALAATKSDNQPG